MHENIEIKKPKALKDEHIEYLNELLEKGALNMFASLSSFTNSFHTLNKEEAGKIVQYWLKIYNKDLKINDYKSIFKIFAITYSNKSFRVLGEFKNENLIDILPPNKVQFCNLIYNMSDKKVIKSKYLSQYITHDVILSLFEPLPLITVDDFIEEFDETFNNKGD